MSLASQAIKKIILLFCMLGLAGVMTSSIAAAQTADTQYERWLGSIEGENDITPGGEAWLYDVHMVDENTLRVEKSTGHRIIRQTYPFTKTESGIRLADVEGSAVPEFNNVELVRKSDRQIVATILGKETLTLRPVKSAFHPYLQWIFLFLLVFIGNELCRHYKYFNHFLFILVPIVLTPTLWINSGWDDWFRWVKLYSAMAGSLIFMAFRFHGLNKFDWMKWAVAGILAINIFEACTKDFSHHHWLNYVNAAAGILCILTITHIMGIKRDENKPHDMLWPGMTVFWILAYDIWNVTFSYLNLANTVFDTLAILTAPTIAAIFIKKGTWLQARANTLTIYMMYLFTTAYLFETEWSLSLLLPVPRSELITYCLVGASITTNVALAFFYFRWKFTGKAPAKLQIGQSESVI